MAVRRVQKVVGYVSGEMLGRGVYMMGGSGADMM